MLNAGRNLGWMVCNIAVSAALLPVVLVVSVGVTVLAVLGAYGIAIQESSRRPLGEFYNHVVKATDTIRDWIL